MAHRFSFPVLVTAAVLSLALIAPASARKRGASSGIEPTEAQQAVHQLRQQIAAEELVVALNPTKDQQVALADLVADLIAAKEAHHAERADKATQLQGLLEDYLAEVRKDGEVSEATVAALREVRAADRPAPEDRMEARQDAKEALQAILSDEQQQALKDFRPMSAVGPTDAEKAERTEMRRERRDHAERAERGEHGERAERGDRGERGERRERKHTRRAVRDVMLSPAFLEALTR